MKRLVLLLLALVYALTPIGRLEAAEKAKEFRRLPLAEYRDKMKAGWLGQIAGVTWGAPPEFKFKAQIIPADQVPVWNRR